MGMRGGRLLFITGTVFTLQVFVGRGCTATWVTDPATGVTIDTATGAVVPAETVAAAAAAAIVQK